jgi:hypothetical protein
MRLFLLHCQSRMMYISIVLVAAMLEIDSFLACGIVKFERCFDHPNTCITRSKNRRCVFMVNCLLTWQWPLQLANCPPRPSPVTRSVFRRTEKYGSSGSSSGNILLASDSSPDDSSLHNMPENVLDLPCVSPESPRLFSRIETDLLHSCKSFRGENAQLRYETDKLVAVLKNM